MRNRGALRERVIRILLTDPDGLLTKYRVAKKADCSYSWVYEFLGKLEILKLVSETKVIDYTGLLKYWLQVRIKPDMKDYMYKDPLSLIRRVKMPYALTTYQAENLVQRYLFPSRTDLYVKAEDMEKWHKLISSKGLVGKGNLRLLIADPHVFYGSFKRQKLNIVCIPQLILDLFEEGGVCTEAAEKLLGKAQEYVIRAK